MRALSLERVQVQRERRDEGLPLTGLHLGDVSLVQRHAAEELHVEVPLAERAPRRLAHGGKRVRQDVVDGLALRQTLAEDLGTPAQLVVGERLHRVLERVDAHGDLAEASQLAFVGVEETQHGH